MALHSMILEPLAILYELLLAVELLTGQVRACFLEVLNLDACLLFSLFAFLDILHEIVRFELKLLCELLDTLAAGIHLLGHALLLLHTRC